MSNGVQIFVNMKIFLIILLGFIRSVFCSQLTNLSETNEDVCPVTWFRRKRANLEYTRWRSNMDTTAEFIVKVLDDEMSTTNNDQIVAVNILPVTKRGEKIIVGGAMVPPPTVISSEELPQDYTRFVPPTTPPRAGGPQPMLVEGQIYSHITTTPMIEPDHALILAPNKPEPSLKEKVFFAMNPMDRNSVRDESPPASPQFLPHVSSIPAARQYAPIAPVAFSPRSSFKPLTPPSYDHFVTHHAQPTRTTSYPTIMTPTRTLPDELPFFQAFLDDIGVTAAFLTRTTTVEGPDRTTTHLPDVPYFDDEFHGATKHIDIQLSEHEEDDRRSGFKTHRDKDSDSNYNDMFLYHDDYKETSKKQEDNEMTERDAMETVTADISPLYDLLESENKTVDMQEYSDNSIEHAPANISNAQDLKEAVFTYTDEKKSRDKRRPICNLIKLRQLDFNTPRTLPEIVAQMKQWTEESPVVRWNDITGGNLTAMENPIYIMIVDDPSVGQVFSKKENVLIVAGIEGRDHYAVAAAMYILYQLIEQSELHADLLGRYRFWIIPVFNPDGYDYSMTFPHRREWVKNMRQTWDICKGRESCRFCESYGLRCTISPCYGVNLDRNFEYQWIPPEELRAEQPCGNVYAGTRQLSEVETQSLTTYLHQQDMPISVFIALKEGNVRGVLYPFSHTKKRRAFDSLYRQRANFAATSAYSIAGNIYVAGQTSDYLPLHAGGIEDWADGHLGIDNAYAILLFRRTNLKTDIKVSTERAVHEAYAAMNALLNSMKQAKVGLMRAKARRLESSATALLLVSLASFLYSLYKNSVT